MVQVMSKPPQGEPQWTKAALLHFVSIDATPEQVRDLFTRFGVDPTSLNNNPAGENVRAVLYKHIEAIPGDGDTIVTIPPVPAPAPKRRYRDPGDNDGKATVWDKVTLARTVIIAAVALGLALAALFIAIVAYTNTDNGPSEAKVEEIVNSIIDVRQFEDCVKEVEADNEIYGTKLVPADTCKKS